jgi:Ni,Fe-hydrogenase maturation factor
LTPELVEALAGTEEVVFVDAQLNATEVEMERVAPVAGASRGHGSDPGWLLALTELLHGPVPPAWLLTIPAVGLEFGGPLSARATRGMAVALERIEALLEEAFQGP